MEGFRFLSENEYYDNYSRLLRYCEKIARVTDFAILEGAFPVKCQSKLLFNGFWWLRDMLSKDKMVLCIDPNGDLDSCKYTSDVGARPVIDYSVIASHCDFAENLDLGLCEVECGEYPRNIVDDSMARKLDFEKFLGRLKKSGKSYTLFVKTGNKPTTFAPKKYEEYEYQGKKFINMISENSLRIKKDYGRAIEFNKPYWVKVEPITWIVDEKNNVAITKDIVFGGVPFNMDSKVTDFDDTFIKKYMDTYFANEILPKGTLKINPTLEEVVEDDEVLPFDVKNPYGFDLGKVSEEDIVRGTIESDVSVFLHGKSSDGKSARVKELDPDCEIIYMRNATPDSLNGKSVYDASTGKMIDVPPSWYKKIVDNCSKEPDKIHIVFFDELTNALPSMQGMAFNIILDREVNGKWKLPENARIVAAGNDINDSLAANKMAEPLFNRFAHVYINTEVEEWLNWAIEEEKEHQRLDYEEFETEEKIHPVIISYIENRNNKGFNVLRTDYTGIKPNADPRKWEMASRVLYKTNKPEMLRALVGEELTNDFVRYISYEIDDYRSKGKDSKRLSL